MMNSLMILDKCLLDEDGGGVTDFLNSIDPKSGNEKMQLFAEYFELPVVEVYGSLYVHTASASIVLGYAHGKGLHNLLGRYGIPLMKVVGCPQREARRIREKFGLSRNDSKATLLGC